MERRAITSEEKIQSLTTLLYAYTRELDAFVYMSMNGPRGDETYRLRLKFVMNTL